jgi:hypothetical protein
MVDLVCTDPFNIMLGALSVGHDIVQLLGICFLRALWSAMEDLATDNQLPWDQVC